MKGTDRGTVRQFSQRRNYLGNLDESAKFGDHKHLPGLKRNLIGLASFTRPKASALCVVSRLVKSDVLGFGSTRSAARSAEYAGGSDGVVEAPVKLIVSRDYGSPARVSLRCRSQRLGTFVHRCNLPFSLFGLFGQ